MRGDGQRQAPSAKKLFHIFSIATASDILKPTLLAVIEHIRVGIEKIFSLGDDDKVLHNSVFWDTFIESLLFQLIPGMMAEPEGISESRLRKVLLTPLLQKVAHSVSIMKVPQSYSGEEEGYVTNVLVEHVTESRQGVRGNKPSVDYTLTAFVNKDSSEPLFMIPVETKKEIVEKDISQLAHYMSTMGKSKYLEDLTFLGILLDQNAIRLAFSPFNHSNNIDIPFVLVSPPLNWRSGIGINRGTCVLMCLLHRLRLPRISARELAISFQNAKMEPAWTFILEKAEVFAKEPCLAERSQIAGIPIGKGFDAVITEIGKIRSELHDLQGKMKSELHDLRTEVNTIKQEEPHRRKAPRVDPA